MQLEHLNTQIYNRLNGRHSCYIHIARVMAPFSPLTAEIPEELLDELRQKVEYIIDNYIHESWVAAFQRAESELIWALYKIHNIKKEKPNVVIFPEKEEEWFAIFKSVPLDAVSVVILGQDPYPHRDRYGIPYACGMSFSSHLGQDIPHSLRNIFKRIEETCKLTLKQVDGYLGGWAEQGVFLLNTCLTVIEGAPGSMMQMSNNDVWTPFIGEIIFAIVSEYKYTPFLLWGRPAQQYVAMCGVKMVNKLEANHPAYSFNDCNHFVEANEILKDKKRKPIDWSRLHPITEE